MIRFKNTSIILLAACFFLSGCVVVDYSEENKSSHTQGNEYDVHQKQIQEKEKASVVESVEQAAVNQNSEKDKPSTSEKNNKESKAATKTTGTTNQIPVELVRAIDGDTIRVIYEGKEYSVRYLLVDTPETSHPTLEEQPFGQEAKVRNDELLRSGDVTIEFDVGERYDRYDRLLAYVYVDGKSVQETLLEEGLARVAYIYPPNTRYLDSFEIKQAFAKENTLGIWSIES